VDYLRKKEIGRATFLSLDMMNFIRDKMNANFQEPPNSKRLFDLLNIKSEDYKIAFYFALKDTLVAQDID